MASNLHSVRVTEDHDTGGLDTGGRGGLCLGEAWSAPRLGGCSPSPATAPRTHHGPRHRWTRSPV
eukprot:707873-Rhodomonas_salina.2